MAGYEACIVGLVDILGVSERLSNPATAQRYAEAVAAILRPMISDKGELYFSLPHVDDDRKIEITLSPGFLAGSKVSFISDSIVISAPVGPPERPSEKSRAILACVEAIKGLQRSLLMLGLRSRGGISIGGLVHSGELLVGDGLLQAYNIERHRSVNPRTVVDASLVDHLCVSAKEYFPIYSNRVAHGLREDDDGLFFVDYLTFCPTEGYCGLEAEFPAIIQKLKDDLESDAGQPWVSKLEWLLRYVMASQTDCEADKFDPFGHAQHRFSHVFPRTGETLREYMASEDELARVLKSHDPLESDSIDRNFPLWPLGWRAVVSDQRKEKFNAELKRELCVGHVLYAQDAKVLGRFEFSDDFLYWLPDGRVAQVHLTWMQEDRPEWPWTTIFPTFHDWAEKYASGE